MIESRLESFFPSEFSLLLGIGFLLIAVAEIGYRMGKSVPRKDDTAFLSEISGYQSAVLGLLALLLGFTFSMALNHYDLRRKLVIQEANSIGTTYLRTSFLPGASRNISQNLLRDYLNFRITQDTEARDKIGNLKQIAVIQSELWKQAEIAANIAPTAITASYITSLNETIDLASTQLATSRFRVPGVLWLILLVVSLFGIWASGFSSGVNRKRALFLTVGLPVLITLVLLMITDISSPSRGLIRTDYSSMTELRDSMNRP